MMDHMNRGMLAPSQLSPAFSSRTSSIPGTTSADSMTSRVNVSRSPCRHTGIADAWVIQSVSVIWDRSLAVMKKPAAGINLRPKDSTAAGRPFHRVVEWLDISVFVSMVRLVGRSLVRSFIAVVRLMV